MKPHHKQLQPSHSRDRLNPTDRLFLGIFPDANARSQIDQLALQLRATHGLHGKLLAADRLHVSLHHLGDYSGIPVDVVRTVETACSAVAATMSPFEVEFDRVLSFTGSRGRRPLVMRDSGNNAALIELHKRLGVALGGLGGNSKFTPHITLLYDEQDIVEGPAVKAVRWLVREFVLVHSFLGQSRYLQRGKWTLCK